MAGKFISVLDDGRRMPVLEADVAVVEVHEDRR
jgi:hypothetical protein